jgi:hypothetical protein
VEDEKQPPIIDPFSRLARTKLFETIDLINMAAAEQKVAAEITKYEPKYLTHIPKLIRTGAFPNHTPGSNGCGGYGMHTHAGGISTAVTRCLRALSPIADSFDALYVTGQSGIVPASVVAFKLKKSLIILRKKSEENHGSMIEGDAHATPGVRYIIIDDFMSRGATMDRLLQHKPTSGTLAGICLYGHPRTDREVHVGFAKVWRPMNEEYKREDYWLRLVRRGPRSIIFDIVREAGWRPTVV